MDFALLIQELFSGLFYMMSGDGIKTLIMFIIAGILIALAIVKDYEPTLLLPIGFGCILANLPPVDGFPSVLGEAGFLSVLFNAGIAEGTPQLLEHNDIKWITPAEIPNYSFCPADEEILAKIYKVYK